MSKKRYVFAIGLSGLIAGVVHAQGIQRDYPYSWNKPIGYAEVVQRGDTLYVSGMTGEGASMADQVTAVYGEIGKLLAARGLDSKAIIKENVYTRDIDAFKAAGEIRKAFYKDEVYPAATWVQIDRLYNPEQLVEIEIEVAVAVKP